MSRKVAAQRIGTDAPRQGPWVGRACFDPGPEILRFGSSKRPPPSPKPAGKKSGAKPPTFCRRFLGGKGLLRPSRSRISGPGVHNNIQRTSGQGGNIAPIRNDTTRSRALLDLFTPTITVRHFGSYFLSTRRGPRVVPHPATLKNSVAGRPRGPGGAPGGGRFRPHRAPRTTKNKEVGYLAVAVAVFVFCFLFGFVFGYFAVAVAVMSPLHCP
jgi:hypothetical protein